MIGKKGDYSRLHEKIIPLSQFFLIFQNVSKDQKKTIPPGKARRKVLTGETLCDRINKGSVP